jgi:lipopolysaccharide biosynthesis glycosyltransferase
MQPSDKYFCAGVMIINLQYWREHKVAEQAIDFLLKYSPYAADQDSLNYVIRGNYIELHPRWNVMRQEIFSNYNTEILEEAYKNPAIIHIKTWKYKNKYSHLYAYYRKFTLFPKFTYEGKTVPLIIQNYLKTTALLLIGEKNCRKIKSFVLRNSINGGVTVRVKDTK